MPDTDPLFPLPEVQPAAGAAPETRGKPRLETANRQQVEMRFAALDDLLPEDHRARLVWALVQDYDLSRFYGRIKAVEGDAGRPAIDPRLLIAVWLYATLEGVVSGRELDQVCKEHLAYQWLLGGVTVNYHTLTDFRTDYAAELDDVLTKSVAALLSEGVVSLDKTAQDGVRIRASAGASSFRRKPTLEDCLRQAEAVVVQQNTERESTDPTPRSAQRQAAQQRHAQEKVARVKKALTEVDKLEAKKAKRRELKRKAQPARASTTDPEARVMKMADGGFRPAYSGQWAIDMESRLIVGVAVSNEADVQELQPMLAQLKDRYGHPPRAHYVDGGFRSNANVEIATAEAVTLFTPIPERRGISAKPPEDILPTDGAGVRAWKARMVTPEAKAQYKQRAATIEWANALARLRGLYQLTVRGLHKARAVLLWFALAHNLLQTVTLRTQRAVAAGQPAA
jgi:transposase